MAGKKKALRLTLTANQTYKGSDGKIYSHQEGVKLLQTGNAVRSSWHGGKKNDRVTYEGTQYTGGRRKNTKNLTRTDDGLIKNQYGVTFTEAEKKKLENEVNKTNRLRKKMLQEEGNLPRVEGGIDTGMNVSEMHKTFGKESDFIIARKSKSLQQFRSREDYENYMRNLEWIRSPRYIEEKTRQYKRSHTIAIENVFGDEAKDVINKIRSMRLTDYRKLLQSDEALEISYLYDPSELTGRLNQIRAALGIKLKD